MQDPMDAPATKRDIAAVKGDIVDLRHHFEVVTENLADDFRASSKDQVAVLRDTLLSHDRRITKLEKHAGVA